VAIARIGGSLMRLSTPIFRLKRQAKQLSRESNMCLTKAQDSVAVQEGFKSWGQLATFHAKNSSISSIYKALTAGDLVLLAARPGQGKTLISLELAIEAIKSGQYAAFYSLEATQREVISRLESLQAPMAACETTLTIDTSDEICASHIIQRSQAVQPCTFIVVDYLQLLDQARTRPPLAEQLVALKAFAKASGAIVVMISQIDRSFEAASRPLPDMSDIRLPNPINLSLFTKTLFINEGAVEMNAA